MYDGAAIASQASGMELHGHGTAQTILKEGEENGVSSNCDIIHMLSGFLEHGDGDFLSFTKQAVRGTGAFGARAGGVSVICLGYQKHDQAFGQKSSTLP